MVRSLLLLRLVSVSLVGSGLLGCTPGAPCPPASLAEKWATYLPAGATDVYEVGGDDNGTYVVYNWQHGERIYTILYHHVTYNPGEQIAVYGESMVILKTRPKPQPPAEAPDPDVPAKDVL